MRNSNSALEVFYSRFDALREEVLSQYLHFLEFKTVGSDLSCSQPLRQCANWVCSFIRESGFTSEVWETPAGQPPVVFGEWLKAGADKPTVMFYGHYDVQPVDPLSLWESPPFEPKIRGEEVYARGAQDNKGQCIYFLYAIRSMLQEDGSLPLNVKICIEGQEEIGSAGLQEIVGIKKEALRSDYLVIVDSFLKDLETPAVSLGARGSTFLSVEFTGSASDLHSGLHGGIAYNPNKALVEVASKFYDSSGRVAVPGFYDGIIESSPEDLEQLSFDFDAAEYERAFGAKPSGGESDYPPAIRNTLRPTLEINGISGGYSGEGVKMVIPAKATLKISARLVPGQDPDRIAGLISDFIKANTPEGIAVSIWVGSSGLPIRTSPKSKVVQATASAFGEVLGKQCKFVLDGVTIPPASKLAQAAGAEAVLIGCGLPDDNIHAPNEHFGLDRIRLGFVIVSRILEILGEN